MVNIFKKFSTILTNLWVIIYIFDSLLQYGLHQIGLENFILFFKTIIPFIIIILGFVKWLYSPRIGKKVSGIIILISYSVIIAIINRLPFLQIAYGLKTMLPFIAFYCYKRYLNRDITKFKTVFRVVTPIIIFGLLMDKYVYLPWEGLSYKIGDVTYQISREWETFGMVRLSGFQRASYDSAIVLSLLLVANSIYNTVFNTVNSKYDIILYIGCIYGIYLTTFKTSYLFLVFLMIYSILIHMYKHIKKSRKKLVEIIMKIFMFSIFLYSLIPPILSQLGISLNLVNSENFLVKFLFRSYSVRMSTTWKEAINLLDLAEFKGILGRGLGGIGTSQQYGELLLYNSADSLFIYLFVTIGFLSLILLVSLMKMIVLTKFEKKSSYVMFYMLLIVFSFGATINIVDSPLLMSSLGGILAYYVDMENLVASSGKPSQRGQTPCP